MPSTSANVRVPQITSLETAIRLYYERIELSNSDIRELFGKLAPATIKSLKNKALAIMTERNTPVWNSILNGIDRIQDYEIIIHPRCRNFLVEIYNYTWAKDKFGRTINRPIDDFNHLMDAMRYALESLRGGGVSILK